jgi:hypothetical protein
MMNRRISDIAASLSDPYARALASFYPSNDCRWAGLHCNHEGANRFNVPIYSSKTSPGPHGSVPEGSYRKQARNDCLSKI